MEVKRDNTFVDNVVDITFVQFDVSPLDFLNLFNFHFNFILFKMIIRKYPNKNFAMS